MTVYQVTDQTDVSNRTVITGDHFGVNLVTVYDEEFANPDYGLADLAVEMGVTTLRFPGGAATEHFFDMADPDATVSNFDAAETLLPMTGFLAQAGQAGIAASIVIPTQRGFTQTAAEALLEGSYGERSVDPDYLQQVLDFVRHTLDAAAENGVEITAFELGNEFWGSGEMTAGEYGSLVARLAPAIDQLLADLGQPQVQIVVQSQAAASQLFSPRDAVTAYVDPANPDLVLGPAEIAADFGGTPPAGWTAVTVPGQGTAYWQLADLVEAINARPGAGAAIDGLVDHYYVRGGFDEVDTSFGFGFDQINRFGNLLDRPDDLPELELHITEWNANSRDALNNRGLQHAGMMVENFYELTTHGVDSAQIWPLTFDQSQNITLVNLAQTDLTIAGEMFSMMRDSLVDLTPTFDWSIDGNLDVHGFSNADRMVVFAGERSGSDRSEISLDLSQVLDSGRYFVTATHLGDGGAGGQDHRAQPVLTYQDGVMLSGTTFDFSLESWAMMQLEITRIGGGRDVIEGQSGDDRMRGFGGADTLRGEDGNDWLQGGSGGDTLLGGQGRDALLGGDGNDRLLGGQGRDRLIGGGGDDTLIGGSGRDLLTGGSGQDTFVFASGPRVDVITDFDVTQDLIDLRAWEVNSLEDLLLFTEVSATGRGAVRSFIETDDGRIRLNGVDADDLSSLTEDHFIFG